MCSETHELAAKWGLMAHGNISLRQTHVGMRSEMLEI